MVWNEALINPVMRTRWVVIFSGDHEVGNHVMPCKHLVSPLLLVNKESRCHALKFFDIKLAVHHVGQLDSNSPRVKELEKFDKYARKVLWMTDEEYDAYLDGVDSPGFEKDFPELHYRDWASDELVREVEDLIEEGTSVESGKS